MIKFRTSKSKNAQTAVEYLLLLAAVVAVTLVSFNTLLPRATSNTQLFFNKASVGITGAAPRCGDGVRQSWENSVGCCADFNACGF